MRILEENIDFSDYNDINDNVRRKSNLLDVTFVIIIILDIVMFVIIIIPEWKMNNLQVLFDINKTKNERGEGKKPRWKKLHATDVCGL